MRGNSKINLFCHSNNKTKLDSAATANDIEDLPSELVAEIFNLTVDAIIVVDPAHRIQGFNGGAEQMFGRSADDACGQPLDILIPTRHRAHHQQLMTAFLAGPESARKMGSRANVTALHQSGREFPAAVSIIAVQTAAGRYAAAIMRDLSENEVARKTLEKSERRLRAAQRVAGIGYWDLDIEADDLVWSEDVFRIFGLTPEYFGGTLKDFFDLVHPEDLERVREHFAAAVAGESDYTVEHRILRPDGSQRIVLERGEITRDKTSGTTLVEGIVEDVTAQRANEKRLQCARNEAVAASEAKSRFMATMGHELRTPLNAISGFSQILVGASSDELDPRYSAYARYILDAGEHLTGIINRILDATRVDNGRLQIHEDRFALDPLLKAATNLLQTETQSRNLTLSCDFDTGATVVGDKQMIRQILFNLASNALKFSPANSTVILASQQRADKSVAITVADKGPGIDLTLVSGPIKPFMRGDDSLTRRHEGLGLGLYLVDNFLRMHGGRLELTHRQEGGTLAAAILPPERCTFEP